MFGDIFKRNNYKWAIEFTELKPTKQKDKK